MEEDALARGGQLFKIMIWAEHGFARHTRGLISSSPSRHIAHLFGQYDSMANFVFFWPINRSMHITISINK